MQGYKNKSKDIICLCIIQAVRLKAVCKAIFLNLKDDSDADNDNSTSNNNCDGVVLTEKEEGGNDEDKTIAIEENGIISVLQSKKGRKSNSESIAAESLTKLGSYYRIWNANMADKIDHMLSILGSIQKWLL